ncbi:MAG TPA: glycogen debranching N-terminal domain-containing protein [Candidatus Dormibacteraeota bacterium]|nr:glycogen debranching N-terminal domain-containing protein [Candidatus Dormibacteraeota bacterium]
MEERDPLAAAVSAEGTSSAEAASSARALTPERVLAGTQARMAPWRTLISAVHPHPSVKINHGATFLVTDQQGAIPLDTSGGDYGLYSADTRFLSRHELRINGKRPESVASVRLSFRHARWHVIADSIAGAGGDMRETRVAMTIDRLVSLHQLHEDLVLHTYGRAPLTVLLEIALESDFADLFEVRYQSWQRRADLNTWWVGPNCLEARYQNKDFVRRCLVRTLTERAGVTYANGALRFPIDLQPGVEWKVCLQYDLLTDDHQLPDLAPRCLFESGGDPMRQARSWQSSVTHIDPADMRLGLAYERAVEDFAALRLHEQESSSQLWMPAAGLPWFMALFGRDSAIASMQAMVAQPAVAMGTLENLARWQSDFDDPERDAEPGKMPHELRVGEWAHFGIVPHRPYYGTADATPLYLLLLAESFRWSGDAEGLKRFQHTAERCLEWIDRHGDRDGDGFQEYAPRTQKGYRNQGWRDAHDGVLDETGSFPELPIGTSEMQAYVYGAKLQTAPLFEAWGDGATAGRLRREARELRRRFMDTFWLEPQGEVAFVLDGRKRAVPTVVSNSGHCMWMGILDPEHGRAAGRRLMQPDMFTGWGLRVLSDRHPSYDPHSYQRGSVWPHDSVIAAAGLRRYGMVEEAWTLLDGLLGAVMCFEDLQMPELFAGLPRNQFAVPVPYRMANVPQAWAAGSILQMVRILLGLEPDLPANRVYVDPALPPWCPELAINGLKLGKQELSLSVRRGDRGGHVIDAESGALEIVQGTPPWLELEGSL